jgi:tRNA uridine 5-carboxymethylaminomethyl modification enzyme
MIRYIPIVNETIGEYSKEAHEQAEIQIKYEVYLQKEEEMVIKMSALENQIIPDSFNYENIFSLSNEARQKFNKIKPQTLGQASRISGVNPSDVQILMVYMGR